MVEQAVESFLSIAQKKRDFGKRFPFRYFLLSMMAGIYVGFGIILIFSIGAPLSALGSGAVKLVMGASFGVALTLVLFAGSELFTGNNMILTMGSLANKVSWRDTFWLWTICYLGNFAGSLLLAWAFVQSGLGRNETTVSFINAISHAKVSAPFMELFFRGVLCNMLVCLAVWTSGKTANESAKLILIFWCLFAFIGSGFEHSVANMTLIGTTLFLPGSSFSDALRGLGANLIPVTLGNIVGGAVFIGAAYWYIASGTGAVKVKNKEAEHADESFTNTSRV